MATDALRDRYANIASLSVTESAAGTLTFTELRTGIGIDASRKEATAILIDEIDYYLAAGTLNLITASGDDILTGITVSNAVTSISDIGDARVLHSQVTTRMDFGTAGNGILFKQPDPHQFFPPLITAERSIFLGLQCNGLASPGTISARLYYRTVRLTEGEFIELSEVFRLVG